MPGRRCGEQRPVGAAGDAEHRQRSPASPAGPGQLEHAARHLALEGGRIEVALAGDDQVGALHAPGQADEAGDEVEARLDAGARARPGRRPGRRRRRRRARW